MNPSLEDIQRKRQLNPHFLFNSLNHLQYYINEGDKRGALSYLTQFSRFMRQALHNAEEITTTVAEEISLVGQYLALESLRFESRFEYSISDKLPFCQTLAVSSLQLWTVVEDMLNRSVLARDEKGFIDITFILDDGLPACMITLGRNAPGNGPESEMGKLTIPLHQPPNPQQ